MPVCSCRQELLRQLKGSWQLSCLVMRAGRRSWTDSPPQNNLLGQGVLVSPVHLSVTKGRQGGSLRQCWCVVDTSCEGGSHPELQTPAHAGISLLRSHAPLEKQAGAVPCQIYQGDPTGASTELGASAGACVPRVLFHLQEKSHHPSADQGVTCPTAALHRCFPFSF